MRENVGQRAGRGLGCVAWERELVLPILSARLASSSHLQICWVCHTLLWSQAKGNSTGLEIFITAAPFARAHDAGGSDIWPGESLEGGPTHRGQSHGKIGVLSRADFFSFWTLSYLVWWRGVPGSQPELRYCDNVSQVASVQETDGHVLSPSAALE